MAKSIISIIYERLTANKGRKKGETNVYFEMALERDANTKCFQTLILPKG